MIHCCAEALDKGPHITVYWSDMNDFVRVNEGYAGFFADDPPARVAIQTAALRAAVDVELDARVALS